jgi:hypothetical protein
MVATRIRPVAVVASEPSACCAENRAPGAGRGFLFDALGDQKPRWSCSGQDEAIDSERQSDDDAVVHRAMDAMKEQS